MKDESRSEPFRWATALWQARQVLHMSVSDFMAATPALTNLLLDEAERQARLAKKPKRKVIELKTADDIPAGVW